jgi:hypothetical protein
MKDNCLDHVIGVCETATNAATSYAPDVRFRASKLAHWASGSGRERRFSAELPAIGRQLLQVDPERPFTNGRHRESYPRTSGDTPMCRNSTQSRRLLSRLVCCRLLPFIDSN